MPKLIRLLLEVENNIAKMIQAIAKDAFGFASILFKRERFELMQPLADEDRPALNYLGLLNQDLEEFEWRITCIRFAPNDPEQIHESSRIAIC